jgi:hypothetical protein
MKTNNVGANMKTFEQYLAEFGKGERLIKAIRSDRADEIMNSYIMTADKFIDNDIALIELGYDILGECEDM